MNKKIAIILSILLIIIALLIITFFFYNQQYSFEKVLDLINPQITENMSLKINSKNSDGNSSEEYNIIDNLSYQNFYINDDIIHEFTFNFETKEQVNIFHHSKEFFLFKIEDPSLNIISDRLNYYKELLSKSQKNSYKYHSKENINNNEIIKISVDFEKNFFLNIDNPVRLYYYINLTQKTIDKIEHYNLINNNETLVSTDNFSYSYNTVTKENVLVNLDDYSDYTYANKNDIQK